MTDWNAAGKSFSELYTFDTDICSFVALFYDVSKGVHRDHFYGFGLLLLLIRWR